MNEGLHTMSLTMVVAAFGSSEAKAAPPNTTSCFIILQTLDSLCKISFHILVVLCC